MARTDPTVVYVHGNGNKLAPAALKAKWDQALCGRDMGDVTRMAYYADLHYPSPLLADEPSGVNRESLEALGDAAPEDLTAFRLELKADLEEEFGDVGPEFSAWIDEFLAAEPDASAKPAPADSTLEALPTRWLRTRALRRMTKRFFKDVYRYFFVAGAEEIRARVRAQLEDLDGPIAVVAHSLGSIIAYDVLNGMSAGEKKVKALVTVGSPLGVREVQDHLVQPQRVPPVVESWTNLADRFDLVALDKRLKNDFEPSGKVTDHSVDNQTSNNHSIEGYVDKREALDAIEAVIGPIG